MLANPFSSSRSGLSPQKALELINFYLEKASSTSDPEIALVLCEDAESSLSHMRKIVKRNHSLQPTEDTQLHSNIATAYFNHAELLKNLGYAEKARASQRKAEKWGYVPESSQSALQTSSQFVNSPESIHSALFPRAALSITPNVTISAAQGVIVRNVAHISPNIFFKDVTPPSLKHELPEADERITSTSQLVYTLALLPPLLSEADLTNVELNWSQIKESEPDEQVRLRTLATDIVRAFVRDELKDSSTVAEVTYLSPVLTKDSYRDLLMAFVDGIDQSTLLKIHLIGGLTQLIRNAKPEYLDADDLVKILSLLSNKLKDTHQQSDQHIFELTLTVSYVLDSMADCHVKDLNREKLHEPLFAYLEGLKGSSDSYLVYQAAYAFQALQYVPDDETPLQATLRRAGKVVEGVSGLVSAVKGLDLNAFIQGLGSIQQGLSGVTDMFELAHTAYEGVSSLMEGGANFMECLKEGLSFTRKSVWYPALRGLDKLLQEGRLTEFKRLVCEAPCRRNMAFQWGVCQRLGETIANPGWDINARRESIQFLGELYINDLEWGQLGNVKQYIVHILNQQVDNTGGIIAEWAQMQLDSLESNGDIMKQSLYQISSKERPSPYPLRVITPPTESPLLDRVQNKPDVEADLRQLKKKRLNERGGVVYISPRAKPNLQATNDTLFDLTTKTREFLDSDRQVLLLLGDSGAGKSTFNKALESDLWHEYRKSVGRIPLFVNLPAIEKPEQDLIPKQLRKAGFTEPQIRELKDYREFILICDGYDESQQIHNLYTSNQLNQPGEWKAKMVISCRSEYIGADYKDRFQPVDRNHAAASGLLQEAVLAPFSMDQVKEYIKAYVTISRPLWGTSDYLQVLNQIPHLQDLVKNPFLLSLALEVLPRLVDPGQDLSGAKITRVSLYDEFVTQWMERGKKRLAEKNLSRMEMKAFERLSDEGFTQNGIIYLRDLAAAIYDNQRGNPIVEYSHFKDQGTWKELFFCREDEKELLREASPLTRSGSQYRFIHRSLLEYGIARAVFEPQVGGKNVITTSSLLRRKSMDSILSFESVEIQEEEDTPIELLILESPLGRKNFVNEPSIIQFLSDRVQLEPLFRRQLLAIVQRSKVDKSVRKAAVNAISILVKAGEQFIGADLRGIQVPGADLSFGLFDSVLLQGADLRKANLQNIWLNNSNLEGALMKGVLFGELPLLRVNREVDSCASSPNGDFYAVGILGGQIYVYGTVDWSKTQVLTGHTNSVVSLIFSPKGNIVASGSYDRTIRIWEAETGHCQFTLEGHTGNVESLTYSSNGKKLGSGSADKTIRIWDTETGICLHIINGHEDTIYGVSFSPQGDRIISGGKDNKLKIWSVETGECIRTNSEHTDWVTSVAYSPKGNQIASGCQDAKVRLWDSETGDLQHCLAGHGYRVICITYSTNGEQIATSSTDTSIRLWDVETGALFNVLSGHSSMVFNVHYLPKPNLLVSGSRDGTVRSWIVKNGSQMRSVSGHSSIVSAVLFSSATNQVVSASHDSTIRIWDAKLGNTLHTLRGHTAGISSIAFSPTSNRIVSGSVDHTVRLWSSETGACLHVFDGHENIVEVVAYSPKANQVASGSYDFALRIWDVTTGASIHTINVFGQRVGCLEYSPDGNALLAGSWDASVSLWNTETGACIYLLKDHFMFVTSVGFSPSGNQIASASFDRTARIRNTETGELVYTLEHDFRVDEVVFSPKGNQIATRSDDMVLRLWDAVTGSCLYELTGHSDRIACMKYSPDGDMIATGSNDMKVMVWDSNTGKNILVIEASHNTVWTLTWRKDVSGLYIIAGSADKSVRQWKVVKNDEAEGSEVRSELCWSSSQDVLSLSKTSIHGAKGLSKLNRILMSQRGAIGEPESPPSLLETSKKVKALSTSIVRLGHKSKD